MLDKFRTNTSIEQDNHHKTGIIRYICTMYIKFSDNLFSILKTNFIINTSLRTIQFCFAVKDVCNKDTVDFSCTSRRGCERNKILCRLASMVCHGSMRLDLNKLYPSK